MLHVGLLNAIGKIAADIEDYDAERLINGTIESLARLKTLGDKEAGFDDRDTVRDFTNISCHSAVIVLTALEVGSRAAYELDKRNNGIIPSGHSCESGKMESLIRAQFHESVCIKECEVSKEFQGIRDHYDHIVD